MVKRAQFSVKTPQINFIYTFKSVISLLHIHTSKGHDSQRENEARDDGKLHWYPKFYNPYIIS